MSEKLTIKNYTLTKSRKDNIYQLHLELSDKCFGIGSNYIDNGNFEITIEDCEENSLFDLKIPLPTSLIKSFEYIHYNISKNKNEIYITFYEFSYEDDYLDVISCEDLNISLTEPDKSEEKYFKLILNTGFFSNLSHKEHILKLWEEEFPDSLSTFDFLTGDKNPESGISYVSHTKGNMIYIIEVKSKEDLTKRYPLDKFFEPDYNKNDFFNDSEYCILEGDNDLTEKTRSFIDKIGQDKFMAITNIYKSAKKLLILAEKKPHTLVIDTTMFNKEKIDGLLEAFKTIAYEPKKVIYLNEVITTEFPYEKWEG